MITHNQVVSDFIQVECAQNQTLTHSVVRVFFCLCRCTAGFRAHTINVTKAVNFERITLIFKIFINIHLLRLNKDSLRVNFVRKLV